MAPYGDSKHKHFYEMLVYRKKKEVKIMGQKKKRECVV